MTHFRAYDECFKHRSDALWHAMSVYQHEHHRLPSQPTLHAAIKLCRCSRLDSGRPAGDTP